MRKQFARFKQENGQILMIGALMATALLGLVGLIVDGGLLYAERRQAQNAADEAALAAAYELWYGGSDEDAIVAAIENAAANSFDSGSGSSVTVNLPPTAGEHVGDPEFVEVIVSDEPSTFFIHVLTPGAGVQGRGVAGRQTFPEPYALVILDFDECRAFSQSGNAGLTIEGGSMMVNSDCTPEAFRKTGDGDLLVEDGFRIDIRGGYTEIGAGTLSPSPETVDWTMDDPLAGLTPPALGPPAPGSPGTAADPETWTHGGSLPDLTLWPGTYYGGFSSNCGCTITLQPGVYIMAGGGFSKAGQAAFVGDGVTIYVTENPTNPTGDGAPKPFDLTGSGPLAFTPPTSGPYAGITLWQDAAISDTFSIRGGVDLVSGAIYAPTAELAISGNASTTTGNVQIIVSKFRLTGNQTFSLSYGDFVETGMPGITLVE